MGVYGINIDEIMGKDTFEYLIADPYEAGKDVPEGFVSRTIPSFTWAVLKIAFRRYIGATGVLFLFKGG